MTTSTGTQHRQLILGLVLAMLAVTLLGCATVRDVDDDTEGRAAADDPLLDEEGATVSDDHDPPPPPTRVTVTGTVNEVADQNAFEIVESDGDRQFLVLVANPDVDVDDVVRVTGSV